MASGSGAGAISARIRATARGVGRPRRRRGIPACCAPSSPSVSPGRPTGRSRSSSAWWPFVTAVRPRSASSASCAWLRRRCWCRWGPRSPTASGVTGCCCGRASSVPLRPPRWPSCSRPAGRPGPCTRSRSSPRPPQRVPSGPPGVVARALQDAARADERQRGPRLRRVAQHPARPACGGAPARVRQRAGSCSVSRRRCRSSRGACSWGCRTRRRRAARPSRCGGSPTRRSTAFARSGAHPSAGLLIGTRARPDPHATASSTSSWSSSPSSCSTWARPASACSPRRWESAPSLGRWAPRCWPWVGGWP